jgi:hypothetical protein
MPRLPPQAKFEHAAGALAKFRDRPRIRLCHDDGDSVDRQVFALVDASIGHRNIP